MAIAVSTKMIPRAVAGLRARIILSSVFKDAADLHDPNPLEAEAVYQQLLANYPPASISWVRTIPWIGPVEVPLDRVDWDDEDSWAASHQGKRVKKFRARIRGAGQDVNPVVGVQVPGDNRLKIIDGHHRAMAYQAEGKPVKAYVGFAPSDNQSSPWFTTHSSQYHSGGNSANKNLKVFPGTAGNAVLKQDILKSVLELSPQAGTVPLPTVWEFATGQSTSEIVKAGAEGYIHGWVCVNPPCGPHSPHDKITHPQHGHGKIYAAGAMGMRASFSDGTTGRLGNRAEKAPLTSMPVKPVVPISKPPASKPRRIAHLAVHTGLSDLADQADAVSDGSGSDDVMASLDKASEALRAGDAATAANHLDAARRTAVEDDDDTVAAIDELHDAVANYAGSPVAAGKPVSTAVMVKPAAAAGKLTPADVGPFGAVISKMAGDEESQQDVMRSLHSLPADQQRDLLDRGYVKDIQVGNRLPGLGKGIIGSYNPANRTLKVTPDDEAGDTALHEVMHGWDEAHGVTAGSANNGWYLVDSMLERNYPQMFSHYSRAAEGRKVAEQEKFAQLASQYLQRKPLNLGPRAPFTAADTQAVENFFQKIGLNRG